MPVEQDIEAERDRAYLDWLAGKLDDRDTYLRHLGAKLEAGARAGDARPGAAAEVLESGVRATDPGDDAPSRSRASS